MAGKLLLSSNYGRSSDFAEWQLWKEFIVVTFPSCKLGCAAYEQPAAALPGMADLPCSAREQLPLVHTPVMCAAVAAAAAAAAAVRLRQGLWSILSMLVLTISLRFGALPRSAQG